MTLFYDLNGMYVVGGNVTKIDGMIGITSGAVTGIVEDGHLPIGELTLIGELASKEGGHQFACVLPSSQGLVYGAIAYRKGAEAELEGNYKGIVFRLNPLQEIQTHFDVAGRIQFDLKATPHEEPLDN